MIGGNLAAAAVGIGFGLAFPHTLASGAAAAGLATAVMLLLGCLHPPSAAVAFAAATAPVAAGWDSVIAPIGLCSALLCLAGTLYAPVVRRAYPHAPPSLGGKLAAEPAPAVAQRAAGKGLAEVTCAEAMPRELFSVGPSMDAETALKVLTDHALREAPVLDAKGKVLGLVRRAELLLEVEREATEGAGAGRIVGEMLDAISTVAPDAPLTAALPILAGGLAPEVVVVDADGAALGVITQTDVLAAVWKGGAE